MDDLSSATVKQWLESLLLPQYLPLFDANGYNNLSDCSSLTEADLDRMGLMPPGHKKRLLSHLPSKGDSHKSGVNPPLPMPCRSSGTPGYINMDSRKSTDPTSPRLVPLGQLSESLLPPTAATQRCSATADHSYVASDGSVTTEMAETEEVYQVPPSRPTCVVPPVVQEAIYANVDPVNNEKPPLLPPKQRGQRESLEDKFGMQTAAPAVTIEQPKRPVPAPRRSLMKKPTPAPRPHVGMTLIGATVTESSDEQDSPESSVGTVMPDTDINSSGGSVAEKETKPEEVKSDPAPSCNIYNEPEDDEVLENERNEQLESLDISSGQNATNVYEDVAGDEDDYLPMDEHAMPTTCTASSTSNVVPSIPSGIIGLKDLLNSGGAASDNVYENKDEVEYEVSDHVSKEERVVSTSQNPDNKQSKTSLDLPIPLLPCSEAQETSTYQGIWQLNSGPTSTQFRPTSNLIRFDSIEDSQGSSDVGVTDKVQRRREPTWFDKPPPSFQPPPLPPGVQRLSGLPPALPPRNKEEKTEVASPPLLTDAESDRDSSGFYTFSSMRNAHRDQVEASAFNSMPELPSKDDACCRPLSSACSADPFSPIPTSMESRKSKFRNLAAHSKSEENFYEDSPLSPCRSLTPDGASFRSSSVDSSIPSPPSKVPNSWKDLYGASRATYCLQEDMDSSQGPDYYSWESDDTLSDGGDFYEPQGFQPPPIEILKAAIPIVPAVHRHVTERKGFLHKYSSVKSKRRGWLKRWVTFDGQELAYFSNNKSMVSKRVIPGDSMVDLNQVIKKTEQHSYRFQLKTVDRVYTFAAEDADDLAMWCSILMQAIIERRKMGLVIFPDGGEMAEADKEGFVKIEGVKGRRFVALKKDKFCYYNTYSDYKAGCPVHKIEMKLAAVKEPSKNKLQLLTPYITHVLAFESSEEAMQWRGSLESAINHSLSDDSVLKQVYENQHNKYCADCGAPEAEWASVNFAMTLCKNCAGIHRNLVAPSSKIRSLTMDQKVWTPDLIKLLKAVGNENANNYWEWNSTEDDRIDSDVDIQGRKDYIMDKYAEKRFCRQHPLYGDQKALNEALCKAVQYDNILETVQLIYSGADILCSSKTFGAQEETPLQLAKAAGQTVQAEFLRQNGAEGLNQPPVFSPPRPRTESYPRTSLPTLRGHLYKTGPSHRGEFLKRYCVLQDGTLTYYENERSMAAKDSIERKEMLSLALVKDDRSDHTFELTTLKQGGRTYLFAASSEESRINWVHTLAKNFAPIETRTADQIKAPDRGGLVYLRDGATGDWERCWIHLKNKTLFLYRQEGDEFEEIDLRKIKSILKLQNKDERCTNAFEITQPFVVDLPTEGRALYIQTDMKKDSEAWFNAIHGAATDSDGLLKNQQLTLDDVPLLVDRCINFIDIHGLQSEGIYRLNGQHSKVSKLLELLNSDARSVHIREEEYTVNEVATVLKRYFRQLDDPLLTVRLYTEWIEVAGSPDLSSRLQHYKYLLGLLPTLNYCTLKKTLSHLTRVTEQENVNKMGLLNLASIFGPALMTLDKGTESSVGFGSTSQEIGVLKDLLENHRVLFEIKAVELEKEHKLEEARLLFERLNSEVRTEQPTGDLLIPVYIENMEGQVITLKVSSKMTAGEVLDYVLLKAELDMNRNWGLFEIISNKELVRPLHFMEKVLDVTMRWSTWPESVCAGSFLCLKHNNVYENIELVFDPLSSLFSELKFSEKKGFKKFFFEFGQYKLSYQKDTKSSSPLGSWNVEDLTVYIGVQQKRSPPTKWGFTFIQKTGKESHKDSQWFGHSVCCTNKQELYRWLAAIVHAQHPEGLIPGGAGAKPPASSPSQIDWNTVVPAVTESPLNRQRGKSIIQRIMHKR